MHADTCLAQLLFEGTKSVHAVHLGVESDERATLPYQPFGDGRAVDIRLAHQSYGAVFQFDSGLQVVAAVCPKQRLVHRAIARKGLHPGQKKIRDARTVHFGNIVHKRFL